MQAFARHVLPVLGLLAIALAPSRALGLCQAPRNEVVSPLATAAGDGFLVAWTFAFATPKSSGVKLLEVARDGAPRTEPTTLDLGATPVALWTGADGSPMFFGVRPGAGLVTGRLAKGAAPQPFSAGGYDARDVGPVTSFEGGLAVLARDPASQTELFVIDREGRVRSHVTPPELAGGLAATSWIGVWDGALVAGRASGRDVSLFRVDPAGGPVAPLAKFETRAASSWLAASATPLGLVVVNGILAGQAVEARRVDATGAVSEPKKTAHGGSTTGDWEGLPATSRDEAAGLTHVRSPSGAWSLAIRDADLEAVELESPSQRVWPLACRTDDPASCVALERTGTSFDGGELRAHAVAPSGRSRASHAVETIATPSSECNGNDMPSPSCTVTPAGRRRGTCGAALLLLGVALVRRRR